MKLKLVPLLVSWVVTTLVVAMGMMGLGVLYAQHQAKRYRLGWNLMPVLVATHRLEAGAVLKPEDVAVKGVPEQFVTSSVFNGSELSTVLGRTLLDPLAKDDLLTHAHLEWAGPSEGCVQTVRAAAADAGVEDDPEVKRAIDAMVAQAPARSPHGN